MVSEYHKCFDLKKKGETEPLLHFNARMGRVDSVLKFFKEIKPEDLNIYVSKLTNNFYEAIGNYTFDTKAFKWERIRENLTILPNFTELEKSVFLYICKTLKLPEGYTEEQGEIELVYYDRIKTLESVSFYLVRTFVDVYGKEEGTAIYKQVVPLLIKEMKETNPSPVPEDPKSLTILEQHERSLESWCRMGMADFTFHIFDDHKIVYRFDRCLIPEVLKEFNDPDIAYLASCYLGDVPERSEGEIIRMRRTQTLQHSKFCDELYWNNVVHPNAEQPSLEFAENIGKDITE